MTSDTPYEPKSAIYVDTENLGGPYTSVSEKAQVIQLSLEQWPVNLPALSRIRAYIDPRKENLWQEALSGFTEQRKGAFNVGIPGLAIETPALQQYSRNAAKNALDITLALDVLSDLILGRADFAAIISSDSDFASLYFKLRELVKQDDLQPRAEINGIPLLLFTHGLAGVSDEMRGLGENIIAIRTPLPPRPTPETVNQPTPSTYPIPNRPIPSQSQFPPTLAESLSTGYSNEQLAGAVASGIGFRHWDVDARVFKFTYRDVFNAIKYRWPQSQEATPGQSAYLSRWFHENVWPVMEQRGAIVFNDRMSDPRNYSYHLPREVREILKELDPVE